MMIVSAAIGLLIASATATTAVPPRLTNPGNWLADRQPPEGVLRQGTRAMTALDLTIAADGTISDCKPALSSGYPALDDYACRLFGEHARYETDAADAGSVPRHRRDFWVWDAPRNAGPDKSKASAAMPGSGAATWVTTDDIPSGTLAADEVVVSNVKISISPSGRVTACAASVASERPDLDQHVCTLMSARARYRPARDAAGQPVDGVDWKTVRWQRPRD